ncbi:MAG: aminopeptidase N [Kineosporiaceae bacterium]|nr:aminopeptidase N [Kineosporiaceae bacterium]MBK7621625.1 aminopeptidase N [Kineosporiaceae bacterium]MBK8077208.1 aminopeptidase N [Kineosporiaceae bacterium]
MPDANLTRDEAAARAALLTVDSYAIELDLTSSERTFTSRTTVRFRCARPGADTFIDLIAPTVHEVTLNGRSLDVAAVVSEARIALPGLAEDNELTVVADAAYMNTGEGLHRFVDPVDKEVYLYSQFEVADARRVFTCFDQPDLKATFAWTVLAPSHWRVLSVSPSPQPEPAPSGSPDGTAVWRFEPTPRLSTYVTAIVAGPYHRQSSTIRLRTGRDLELGVLCRATLAEHLDADEVMDITGIGFAHFEALYDCDYPFAKYDQVFVPEFNAGAMENAGCVTILEDYIFRSKPAQATVERRALTILHELAHMWFGDLVTMRWWDDLWLNESFAEYASTRCQSEATRWRTAWTTFLSSEKSWAYRQDQLSSTHPIVAEIRDLADVEQNFDGITYAKGASVLKQLVHWVGQDAFDAGLRAYFAKNAWGNTTLADLLAELETASGRDLSAWSTAWLERAGVTTLRPAVTVDDDGVITAAAVLQEAPQSHPTLRPHRLGIGGYDVIDGAVQRVWHVEQTVDGARTEVPELVGRPRPDLLLLNDHDLAYAKIRLDDASMATAIGHLGEFSDSLASTLIWGAAWDMTRDGELAPGRFIDLVLGNLLAVPDASVQSVLLNQLSSTLAFYLAPAGRTDRRDDATHRLLDLLRQAKPGSDTQLLLARSFARLARREDHLDVIDGILDGRRALDGLSVDTDMRWTLLTSLTTAGRFGDHEIQAELDRDDTATGRVRAAMATASAPTAQAKQAAWASVVESDELPNAIQGATIAGFLRVHDEQLLEPFVEPYFAALERIWRERTSEIATQIVEGLFPAQLASEALLVRTQRWLDETTTAEPSMRRLIAEGRDGVQRALKVQSRDTD